MVKEGVVSRRLGQILIEAKVIQSVIAEKPSRGDPTDRPFDATMVAGRRHGKVAKDSP